ncbi:hypothetical protein BB561_001376 [Smittium simulii]|uniref:Uncharacterized protein n=1 Tax=Smittium simulii TaxID=133385 RepID=A0A2T9YUX8_9FUNG|nr:hypothetical protein BB561_001376 [Smittium simulii]
MDTFRYSNNDDLMLNPDQNTQESSRISKQLRLLGYSQAFNPDNTDLIKVILSDFELSMSKLKELSQENTTLKNKNSILNIENTEQKQNIISLRQNNNKLRSEVLDEAKKSEDIKQNSLQKIRHFEKNENKLRLINSNLKNSLKQALNDIEDERRSLNKVHNDFLKTSNSYSNSTKVLVQDWVEGSNEIDSLYTECMDNINSNKNSFSSFEISILETTQNRIKKLEEHVDLLECSNEQLKDEIGISKQYIDLRDIEIQRLQKQINLINSNDMANSIGLDQFTDPNNQNINSSNVEKRLQDQLDYVQTYADRLEKENKTILNDFANEKANLKNKLSNYKNNNNIDFTETTKNSIDENPSRSSSIYRNTISQNDHISDLNSLHAAQINSNNQLSFSKSLEILSKNLLKLEKFLLTTTSSKNGLSSVDSNDILKHIGDLKKSLNATQNYNIKDELTASEYNLKLKVENAITDYKKKLKDAEKYIISLKTQIEKKQSKYFLPEPLSANNEDLKWASDKRSTKEQLKNVKSGFESDTSIENYKNIFENEFESKSNNYEQELLKREIENLRINNNRTNSQNLCSKCKKYITKTTDIEDSYSNSQNTQALKRYKSLLSEYNNLVEAHQKLDKALKKAIADVEKWHSKVTSRDSDILRLQKKSNELIIILKQYKAEIKSLRIQNMDLKNELKTTKVAHSINNVDTNKLLKELENAKNLNSALELSKQEYKSLYSKNKEECEDKKMLLRQLTLEKDSLNSQLRSLIHRFQRIEQEVKINNYSSPMFAGYLDSNTNSFTSDYQLHKIENDNYTTRSESHASILSKQSIGSFQKKVD